MPRNAFYAKSISRLILLSTIFLLAAPAYAFDPSKEIPGFDKSPTFMSVQSGPWNDPATWDTGRVPNDLDVVHVRHAVTLNTTDAIALVIGIQMGGVLRFDPAVNTKLSVGTLLVRHEGALEIGTEIQPVLPTVTAQIVIRDIPLDTGTVANPGADPEQYGTALIGLGIVTMHGAVKTPTFARLSTEQKKGETTLQLEQPVSGWRAGDRLILPDTRQLDWNQRGSSSQYPYIPQWEELEAASISMDGKTITLKDALKYDHPGARNTDGTLEFLPHVGNLTRNIVIRSENPDGTRGHTLFTHRADVDIRYAAFKDLGRTKWNPDLDSTTFDAQGKVTHIGTNQIARYPLHMHHAMGPVNPANTGYQFTLLGNAIDGGSAAHAFRWGIVVHASHYGLVRDNVVYNRGGGGIVTEDGSESYNIIENNFVMRVSGTGGRMDNGRDGVGFWFRGPNNYVRDNVASSINAGGTYSYGYNIWAQYLGNQAIPRFRGADPMVPGEYQTVNMNSLPLLEFARNEVYGATPNGLTLWWIGTSYRSPLGDAGVVKDFRVWHQYQWGYFGYETNNLTIDGFTVRGDTSLQPENRATGMWFGDYWQKGLKIVHADIQGMGTGILAPLVADGETLIADSYLRNGANIVVTTMASVNGSSGLPAKSTRIRNVKFDAPSGLPLRSISMAYSTIGTGTGGFPTNLMQKDEVFVEDYNQVPGVNFQVFYKEQRANFVVPETGSNQSASTLIGAPRGDIGLTNAQLVAKYPDGATIEGQYYKTVAIAGAIAPCLDDTTRPEVGGFTCPIPPEDAPYPKGDANLSRSVTLHDAVHVIDIILGRRETPAPGTRAHCAADADDNGAIGIADVLAIVNHLIERKTLTGSCS